MHLGGGAVDLVGEDEVGENRAPDAELAAARVVDLGADDVGRQEVGRELDAAEAEAQTLRQRADGQRLGQAGHAFQQDVAAGEQADEQTIQQRAGRR